MADNTAITAGSGVTVAAREVTYSGDSAKAPVVGLVTFAGSDDAKTVADVPAGGGVEAAALRVTLASDSTGVVSVDDNGGSLTVDGTVAISTNAELGIVTETAPGTDTASSGLNGRLQRIAQRLTSLIALLPAALGQTTKAGSLSVTIASDDIVPVIGGIQADPSDGTANIAFYPKATSGNGIPISAMPMLYNGSTWDRSRGNTEATLLASAARTATTNSPDQTNHNGRGVAVTINVTVEGPATLAIKLQGKDSISGNYFDIADFGTIYTAAGEAPTRTKTVVLYPGVLTADHVGIAAGVDGTTAKSGVLPRTWRAVVTHADATTTTYSLAAVTII